MTGNITWELLVKTDPRLQDLYNRIIQSAPKSEWVADELWFGHNDRFGFKQSMQKIVGWYRNIDDSETYPFMTDITAYDVAYRKLYDEALGASIERASYDDPEYQHFASDADMEAYFNKWLPYDDGLGEDMMMKPSWFELQLEIGKGGV